MYFKKLLLSLATLPSIVVPTLTIISCVNQKEITKYTKDEVNKVINEIIDNGELNWKGDSYGMDEKSYRWFFTNFNDNSLIFDLKIDSIFLGELLKRLPDLYYSFPYFTLRTNTNLEFDGRHVGTKNEVGQWFWLSFWNNLEPYERKIRGLNIGVQWSFSNVNDIDFINHIINKELKFRENNWPLPDIDKGDNRPWNYDDIVDHWKKYSGFFYGNSQNEYYEYVVDNYDNRIWNAMAIIEPEEFNKRRNLHINLDFNDKFNSNGLKDFVNNLNKIPLFRYDDLNFNEVFTTFLFNKSGLIYYNLDNKNNLEQLFNDNENFKNFKTELISEIITNINKRFSLEDKNFKNSRLFDEVKVDVKKTKYIDSKEFDLNTQQGIINNVFFGDKKSQTSKNGVLIVELDFEFIKKDDNGKIIDSGNKYKVNMPVYESNEGE